MSITKSVVAQVAYCRKVLFAHEIEIWRKIHMSSYFRKKWQIEVFEIHFISNWNFDKKL